MNVQIRKCNKEQFEAKLAKLNRFAVSINLPEVTWEVTEESVTLDEIKVEMLNYEITGDAPVIAGWTVVARLEHGESNIVFAHESVPELYRNRHVCDHCNTIRNRTTTYVLRNGEEYKQVGGDCLVKYLPTNFERFAMQYKFVMDSAEEPCNAPREAWGAGTLHFLAVSHAAIRKHGYQKTNSDYPTSHLVFKYIFDYKNRHEIDLEITEADTIAAWNTVAWLYEQDNTDYFYNCRTICSRDFVTYKTGGLLASAAFLSLPKKEAKRVSTFFGEVGKRYDLSLKVVYRQYFDSAYGGGVMIKFEDETSDYTWFTSSSIMEVGETYRVKATVKAHDVKYNSTVLTRVKVV